MHLKLAATNGTELLHIVLSYAPTPSPTFLFLSQFRLCNFFYLYTLHARSGHAEELVNNVCVFLVCTLYPYYTGINVYFSVSCLHTLTHHE